MKVLVVDDERPALDELAYLLERDERVREVLTSDSATDALRLLQDTEIDCVFLDIQMPGLTGIELAQVLTRFQRPPAIVFATAHEEHAVQAFDVQAADYLLKPFHADRLAEAVRRVVEQQQPPVLTRSEPPPAGTSPTIRDVADDQIPVELGGVVRFVSRAEVTHVQAQGDYARLHTAAGSHLIRTSLASLEVQWREAGFVRIHRSMLVAVPHITQVRMDGGRCSVQVGPGRPPVELSVSRRHTRELRDLLVRRATP